jgi:hypothetical protein
MSGPKFASLSSSFLVRKGEAAPSAIAPSPPLAFARSAKRAEESLSFAVKPQPIHALQPAFAHPPQSALTRAPQPAPGHPPQPAVAHTPQPAAAHAPQPAVAHTPQPVAHAPQPAVAHVPEPAVESSPEPADSPSPLPAVASSPEAAYPPSRDFFDFPAQMEALEQNFGPPQSDMGPLSHDTQFEKLRRLMVSLTSREYETLGIIAIKQGMTRHQLLRIALDDFLEGLSEECGRSCHCVANGWPCAASALTRKHAGG